MYNEYIEQLNASLTATEMYANGNKLNGYEEGMAALFELFHTSKKNGKRLMFIGNGGSSAIATHMTSDFMKNGEMRTSSLMEGSVLTCMGNDYGYEYVFSKQLEYVGAPDDILVAISSSGNSANIVNAVNVAKSKGMKVVTFSGFKPDNKIKALGDINIYVPICHYGIVESIHNLILQHLVDVIFEKDGIQ